MSVHYHCPKCGKYFVDRAPHSADGSSTCSGESMVAQSYVTHDELPTQFDYVQAITANVVYWAMIVICWRVNPWLALVPIIMQAIFAMAFRSTLKVLKKEGIYRD